MYENNINPRCWAILLLFFQNLKTDQWGTFESSSFLSKLLIWCFIYTFPHNFRLNNYVSTTFCDFKFHWGLNKPSKVQFLCSYYSSFTKFDHFSMSTQTIFNFSTLLTSFYPSKWTFSNVLRKLSLELKNIVCLFIEITGQDQQLQIIIYKSPENIQLLSTCTHSHMREYICGGKKLVFQTT